MNEICEIEAIQEEEDDDISTDNADEAEADDKDITNHIESGMCNICVNYFVTNISSLKKLPDIGDTSAITSTVHDIITTMIEDCPFTAIETRLIDILIQKYSYNIDSKQFIGHINIAELITDLEDLSDNLNGL